MKILLVNPKFPKTFWSFKDALPLEGKKSAFPPLGLLTVSALLPKDWQKRLIDMEVTNKLRLSDIAWADMIFITGMMIQKDAMHEVIAQCKAQGKVVVVGGPYVSTSPGAFPEADHVFVGEAETTLPQFVKDLAAGQAKPFYQAEERPPLALSPVPDFALADLKQYSAMSVQYSRGCPFSCEFCDIIEIYGRVPRTKSNQQILSELDVLNKLGWRGAVFVVDDNFIGNKKNVRTLLPELTRWQDHNNRPFSFFTEASVNLADDDALLEAMHLAGFYRVFLGIETPVEESLKEAQKGQNTRRNLLNSVKKINSSGMEVMAGFIVGFDNDPEDIFERQIEFIRESGIPLAMVGLLTALPDTQLWRRLLKEGRLTGDSHGSNTALDLNFEPKMDRGLLIEGYKTILRTIYGSREYYRRSLECLRRLPADRPEPTSYGLKRAVMAFSRIILRLGIIDEGRTEFWRFVWEVTRNHRSRFAQALRLAAMGYHFRQLNRALD
jgi:radical SAM superfamily enzyme YgiQ (UPF0313 family)